MESIQIQTFAGVISSGMFIFSNLPMILKAFKTKDLKSYSPAHLALSNLGNLIHWFYISSLPFGPIWFLHGFYTLVAAIMLFWYFRFELGMAYQIQPKNTKPTQICNCGCITDNQAVYQNQNAYALTG